MSDKFNAKKYFKNLSSKIIPSDRVLESIIKIKNLVLKAKQTNSNLDIWKWWKRSNC